MKIVLTGGGTGGHFYPLIAVAESLWIQAAEDSISNLRLYYFSDKAYNELALRNQRMIFKEIPSGKLGLSYGIIQKAMSLLRVVRGILVALWKLFILYPDVVLAKGGYASVPTSLAAWMIGIPVFIHESDVVPGRANMLLSKIAKKVFISYEAAQQYFPQHKTVYIGQPVRRALLHPAGEGVESLFELETGVPLLWVFGGSQGAKKINDSILAILKDVLYHVQIIHQTGPKNLDEVVRIAAGELDKYPHASRFHPVAYLDELSIRRIAGVAKLVIGRAGSTLFEIAAWKIPSIIVPIPVSNADHNRKNAYAYAEYGGAVIIEESNLTPEILRTEILRIISDDQVQKSMSESAYRFATPKAADQLANYLIEECYAHEVPEQKPEIPLSILIEQQLEVSKHKNEEKN